MESIVAHHRFLTACLAVVLCAGCASRAPVTETTPDTANVPGAADTTNDAVRQADAIESPAADTDSVAPAPAVETVATDSPTPQLIEPETASTAEVTSAQALAMSTANRPPEPADAQTTDVPDDEEEGTETTYGTTLSEDEEPPDPCDQPDTANWLDGSQEWVYETTCRTAAWFDSFFGETRHDARNANTFGRLGLSGFYDERDGFDPSLRFRATFALPSLRDRATSLTLGRGNEEEIIEERTTKFDTIPGNFNQIDDDSFLVGLGVNSTRRKGFKLSIGAKVRWPPEPYIKLRYHKHVVLTESTLLGIRPIIYWETDNKFGSTLNLELDQLLTEDLMLRWANYGNVATGSQVQGLEWQSSLFLFQAFSNRRAMTYRLLVAGETEAEESLNNYGFELRYRQRVLRKWLFLELLGGVTWPKYLLIEERESNIGIGVGFEAYFGPVPDERMY